MAIDTDGSASSGIEDGAYAGILTTVDPINLNIIGEFDREEKKFMSSYEEEKAALEPPLLWLASHDGESSQVTLICTGNLNFYAFLCLSMISRHSAISSQYLQTSKTSKAT